MGKKVKRYSEIINLPHHQSARRPHMAVYNRAAQFAPFAALSGYDTIVMNTAESLLLDKRINLDEDWKSALDFKIQDLLKNPAQNIKVTYFNKTANEFGGAYVEYEGHLQKLKKYPTRLSFLDGKEILVSDIINII